MQTEGVEEAGAFFQRFWFKCDLKWRYVNTTSKRADSDIRRQFQWAANTWMSAINQNLPKPAILTLTEVTGNNEEADIKLGFLQKRHGDNKPFDSGPLNEFAHAFYPFVTKDKKLHGSIHFDNEERWGNSGDGDILPFIALHEFGHALGLPHATIKNSVMYPSIDSSTTFKIRRLFEADITNIRNLYPFRLCDLFSG
ncbi:PREDICTED: neutrophil collagenase-like [Priapulus caudatus]|uniref:Neutrophil collagenase-like n=1 Tax=Priapulus caudatus TaxID=37621 RepID=A0ABM1E1N0_PRICU|nr:PREDICTED: neutrophil collagenase-like [Priapulus caudatus]